jgi:hypothetical protein
MRTELKNFAGIVETGKRFKGISLTRFYGGVGRGICLQLTIHNGQYIQLDPKTAREMATEILRNIK